MDLKELDRLISVLPRNTEDVDLGDGIILTMHPAGVRNFVKYIVRGFASIREQFLNPARMMGAMSKTDGDAFGSIDWAAQAATAIGDRIEADTAWIAICLIRPNSVADVKAAMAMVERLPEDKFQVALAKAKEMTHGEDPTSFFAEVMQAVTGMDIMFLLTPKLPEASQEAA